MLIKKLKFPRIEKIINERSFLRVNVKKISPTTNESPKKTRLTVKSNSGLENIFFIFAIVSLFEKKCFYF
jgi:hypothetical protein